MGEFWEITVEDNGIGIREEFQERIFHVFQRLHTQDEYPGTGIGRIWLESETDRGTTFILTLQSAEQEKDAND